MLYPFELWADTNLEVKSKSGPEALVRCFSPNHDDGNPSCYFNMETSAYICFSCGFSGSLQNNPEAFTEDIQIKILHQHLNRLMNPDLEPQQQFIPDSALARYRAKHEYWERRNISKHTQEMFELGYDAIANAVTIPLRSMKGDLIGVTRRFIEEDHQGPRYAYPRGFKASQNLFASWLYDEYNMQTVCITEGSIDAMRLWQQGYPAVALYGAMISSQHVRILRQMGVQKVIYFGDGDKAGQESKLRAHGYWKKMDGTYRYKKETDLSQHFLMFHVTDHLGFKDAGEMSDRDIVKVMNTQEIYTPKVWITKERSRV